MSQRKVDVDMLNALQSMLADVLGVSLRQSKEPYVDTLYVYRYADADQN